MKSRLNRCDHVFKWVLLAGFSLVLSSGCTPRYNGVFINETEQSVSVCLFSEGDGRLVSSFEIAPGASVKKPIVVVRAEVKSPSGARLYEQRIPSLGPTFREKAGGERMFHFLVTTKGIYLIPKQYVEKWKDHVGEIINSSNNNAHAQTSPPSGGARVRPRF